MKLVNPTNKRKFDVIVVGTGLAGASAAASLAELGYNVKGFTFHDSPRRAHSIAAQGGINAAKNYKNDGDIGLPPLLRHRQGRRLPVPRGERLPPGRGVASTSSTSASPRACPSPASTAACSTTAPSAAPRSPARSTPGARPASSCCSAPTRRSCTRCRSARSSCTPRPRCSTSSSRTACACGIVARDLITGEIKSWSGHAVLLATGGYGNVFYLSTNAMNCNVTAAWRAHRKGAAVRQPLLHADPPDLHPGERRVPVEAHPHVGVAAQRRPHLGAARSSTTHRPADQIPETDRDYYLERKYPAFGNLVPRDVASRNAKTVVDEGHGVGPLKNGVYLDFADAISRLGERRRRGALRQPLRHVRAHHRREPVPRCRCASTPPPTTRWAGCGSTTTS